MPNHDEPVIIRHQTIALKSNSIKLHGYHAVLGKFLYHPLQINDVKYRSGFNLCGKFDCTKLNFRLTDNLAKMKAVNSLLLYGRA